LRERPNSFSHPATKLTDIDLSVDVYFSKAKNSGFARVFGITIQKG
jgi:hypothetical protein